MHPDRELLDAIEALRRRIDELDRQLVLLLNERTRCAMAIGQLKRQVGLPVYQPEREHQVLANAEAVNQGPLSNRALRRLFERILDEARSVERQVMEAAGGAHPDAEDGP